MNNNEMNSYNTNIKICRRYCLTFRDEYIAPTTTTATVNSEKIKIIFKTIKKNIIKIQKKKKIHS